MAFTIGINEKYNSGPKRVHVLSCSIDSASGNIVTGLNVVDFYTVGMISMATAAQTLKKNTGSNSTAIPGTININSGATGDVFYLVCYGR